MPKCISNPARVVNFYADISLGAYSRMITAAVLVTACATVGAPKEPTDNNWMKERYICDNGQNAATLARCTRQRLLVRSETDT